MDYDDKEEMEIISNYIRRNYNNLNPPARKHGRSSILYRKGYLQKEMNNRRREILNARKDM